MTTHGRTLKIEQSIYERLGKPPTVDLLFLGADLLICAGRKYRITALAVIAPKRQFLLKRGQFVTDVQFISGRWTAVVRDCAHHFYVECTPYDRPQPV